MLEAVDEASAVDDLEVVIVRVVVPETLIVREGILVRVEDEEPVIVREAVIDRLLLALPVVVLDTLDERVDDTELVEVLVFVTLREWIDEAVDDLEEVVETVEVLDDDILEDTLALLEDVLELLIVRVDVPDVDCVLDDVTDADTDFDCSGVLVPRAVTDWLLETVEVREPVVDSEADRVEV